MDKIKMDLWREYEEVGPHIWGYLHLLGMYHLYIDRECHQKLEGTYIVKDGRFKKVSLTLGNKILRNIFNFGDLKRDEPGWREMDIVPDYVADNKHDPLWYACLVFFGDNDYTPNLPKICETYNRADHKENKRYYMPETDVYLYCEPGTKILTKESLDYLNSLHNLHRFITTK